MVRGNRPGTLAACARAVAVFNDGSILPTPSRWGKGSSLSLLAIDREPTDLRKGPELVQDRLLGR